MLLTRLPCRLVIDHIGKFLGPMTPESAAFAALCRLLDRGRCWIKLSAPYETLEERPARLRRRRAAGPRAGRALSRALPVGQQLAASEHATPCPRSRRCSTGPIAASATRRARQKILVDNPAALYRFDA